MRGLEIFLNSKLPQSVNNNQTRYNYSLNKDSNLIM